MKVVLTRVQEDAKQTLGSLSIDGEIAAVTLELPWLNNTRRISRIPNGTYRMIKHNSPKFGACFWVQDVPGRSEILVHYGNYHSDILGCILVGKAYKHLNQDGFFDVFNSKVAMRELLKHLPDQFNLEIKILR